MADFTYIDLFCGIGGFSAALAPLGGRPALSVDSNQDAADTYRVNFGCDPLGDVYDIDRFPRADVLTAGFPCQPFSKAGLQRGTDDVRGMLFGEVLRAVRQSRPRVVLLENVPNLASRRHRGTYDVIVSSLRGEGYAVSSEPVLVSPHHLPAAAGGTPQHRPRVFIVGTLVGPNGNLSPETPVLSTSAPPPGTWAWDQDWWRAARCQARTCLSLGGDELEVLDFWDRFLQEARDRRATFPCPLWLDYALGTVDRPTEPLSAVRRWEANREFGITNGGWLGDFARREGAGYLPPSRRRFEWQAGEADCLSETFISLRPSGVRCKRASTLPAMTAMAQVPILGPEVRYLSLEEGAMAQGLPAGFRWPESVGLGRAWSLLGNAVHPGVVRNVLRALVQRDYSVGALRASRLADRVLSW